MGMRTLPWGKFGPLIITVQSAVAVLLRIVFIVTLGKCFEDAVHITAMLGESIVFNCEVEFPEGHPVPYVLQWEKKGHDIPIYIWYESYPTHSGEGYEGRVSRVAADSPYGAASLNLTNIRESDQGWYECKVVFLNRSPSSHKNGSWFYLDVHAPPRFTDTSSDIIYVNVGNAIILTCTAEGSPTPNIKWFKDANLITPSDTVGIFNDDTELRISSIRQDDIGDYTCIASNPEGQVSHTIRVIIAGGAVIVTPPSNQTKLEGEKVQFACEAKAQPGNVTVRWYREGALVKELSSLETRVTIRRDGSLIVNSVNSDDTGQYMCEVTNGIGDPQSASAYLNVEYPAKVTFTPTIQYLPFHLSGVVQCHIKANPPLQYVTWTKDKRLLEPYQTKDIVIMNNGSLLFTRVSENHQGRYTCTPYNAQGTQGSSGQMEVLVRKPPSFVLEPDPMYQRKVGESVDMQCEAQEAEGTQRPTIEWQRRDGAPLPKARTKILNGNITIEGLRRSDFGFYQCVASNEVATIITATQLVVEGTQPHAPYNVTGSAAEFSVTLSWLPGYSGGPDYKQEYTIWYREAGVAEWSTIPVTPPGNTQATIDRLAPATTYEFQVAGKNSLGDGMMSSMLTLRTLDILDYSNIILPTDATGNAFIPPVYKPKGPKPGIPRNLTVTEIDNGFLITWQPPIERANLIQHYAIKYRTDGGWKTLNKAQIRPEDTHYLVKNLVGGRTYYFRILAYSLKSYESSEEIKYSVPARVKHKAITAGVVGGILFFIVAIILSVCAVKICNKRKRRKQEKAYNMVACRITDSKNGSTHLSAAPSVSSDSQVPLKKFRKGRVPGVGVLAFIANWIWPKDRCRTGRRLSISPVTVTSYSHYARPHARSSSNSSSSHHRRHATSAAYFKTASDSSPSGTCSLARISRTPDGRFVLFESNSSPDQVHRLHAATAAALSRCSSVTTVISDGHASLHGSVSSSSDDGGFLTYAAASVWRHVQPQRQPISTTEIDHIHSTSPHTTGPLYSNLLPQFQTTPFKFQSSSPSNATSQLLLTPWSPLYSTDLSSVRYANSTDPSSQQLFVSPASAEHHNSLYRQQFPIYGNAAPGDADMQVLQLRSVHERYSQELPSLRAIHEEHLHRPMHNFPMLRQPSLYNDMFIPIDRRSIPPDEYPHHPHTSHLQLQPFPRLHKRIARSTASIAHQHDSPESRSSSSGFGSKNTTQTTVSHTDRLDWHAPPYRNPPSPPLTSNPQSNTQSLLVVDVDLASPDPWLAADFSTEHSSTSTTASVSCRPARTTDSLFAAADKMDVGSVDGHYEFDPATPTPTPSTPTTHLGHEYKSNNNSNNSSTLNSSTSNSKVRYDDIDARVQAMKEEFNEFRKRQANRRSNKSLTLPTNPTNPTVTLTHELESAC